MKSVKKILRTSIIGILIITLACGSGSFRTTIQADATETVSTIETEETSESVTEYGQEETEEEESVPDMVETSADDEEQEETEKPEDTALDTEESLETEVSSEANVVDEQGENDESETVISEEPATEDETASEENEASEESVPSQEETQKDNAEEETIPKEGNETKDLIDSDASQVNPVYVVNEKWSDISLNDIVNECAALWNDPDIVRGPMVEVTDTDEALLKVATIIDDWTNYITLVFSKNILTVDSNNYQLFAENFVTQATIYGNTIWPYAGLDTQYFGYAYSLYYDEDSVTVEYTFIYRMYQSGFLMGDRSGSGSMLADIAENELNSTNGTSGDFYYNWYDPDYDPSQGGWCGMFVGYCATQAGFVDGEIGILPPRTGPQIDEYYCAWPGSYAAWIMKTGSHKGTVFKDPDYIYNDNDGNVLLTGTNYQTLNNNTQVQPGDIVIYDNRATANDNTTVRPDHVGIIISGEDVDQFTSIEGNVHDGPNTDYRVRIRNRNRFTNGRYVIAIVRPVSTCRVTFRPNISNATIEWTGKYVAPGNTYGTLPEVSKTGYTFLGWFTTATGGTQRYSTSTVPANSTDHKLFAHWVKEQVTVKYYGYGTGSFPESEYLYSDVFTYGTSGQYLRSTSHASTGYYATGWSSSGNSWGPKEYDLGNEVWDSWIHSHAGTTVKLVQTYKAEWVKIKYYGYGEGYPDSTYYKGASTFRYGQTGQNFWTTSYAQTGYQATGWNTSCNSWASPTYSLGYVITDSWILSHARQLINVAQTFSSY